MADPLPPLGGALLAFGREELATALAQAAQDAHAARVQCKRLRAWLRLLRPALGDQYAAGNTLLRNAARQLAGERQAQALRELCSSLDEDRPEQNWQEVAVRLPEAPQQAGDSANAALLLQQFGALLDNIDRPRITPDDLATALQAQYRRCRKGLQQVRQASSPEALHEWRKPAKYHGYQCQMLASLWPALRARRKRLRALWDALGIHHDLHELRDELNRHRGRYSGYVTVDCRLRWIDEWQRALEAEALRQGGRLFDRKPAVWWTVEIARSGN